MKIGILTFHNSRNYGAVLQAYGLKNVLTQMGHNVEVIDYRNETILKRKTPYSLCNFLKNPIVYILKVINDYPSYKRKKLNFKVFERKYMNVTLSRFFPEDIKKSDYNCLVIGSDQVWSPIITGGPDPVYWGEYKPPKAKLISYAASSGLPQYLETPQYENVALWLNRFDVISVREDWLKSYVETHSSKEATVVLDPTLLAGRNAFDNIATDRLVSKPYILLYSVEGFSSSYIKIAQKVALLYHAEIIGIDTFSILKLFRYKGNGVKFMNPNVQQLISLIKYAECIVAWSFHGTVLSMLFEKDFYSVVSENMLRVETILSKCDLKDRIVDSDSDISLNHIDYTKAKKQLEILRKKSMQWLENAVKQ